MLPKVCHKGPTGGDVVRVLIEERIDGLMRTSSTHQVVLNVSIDTKERGDDVWLERAILGWADEMFMGVEHGNLVNGVLERLHVMTAFVYTELRGDLVADAFFLPVQ